MFWALAIIGLIILGLRFPKFGVAVLVVVIALGLVLFGYMGHQHDQEEAAKRLVRPDQLNFTDMQMGPGRYANYRLTGRIKNNSIYEITGITLKLEVQDCASDGHCETVGQEEQPLFLSIPAGQVRDVDESVYFHDMTIRGTYKWNYSVEEVDAAKP